MAATPLKPLLIYIHGIRTHENGDALKRAWDDALFGVNLGDRSRMAYWGHGAPPIDAPYTGGKRPFSLKALGAINDRLDMQITPEEELAIVQDLLRDEEGSDWMLAAATRMYEAEVKANPRVAAAAAEGEVSIQMTEQRGVSARSVSAKILPLPEFMRIPISRAILKAQLLRDTRDYLQYPERRNWMRDRFIERLPKKIEGGVAASHRPCVILAHSMGTVIAYDVLSDPAVWPELGMSVPLFLTIGSPLGVTELQDFLRKTFARDPQRNYGGKGRLPFVKSGDAARGEAGVGKWLNVACTLDYVALDKGLNREFGDGSAAQTIQDKRILFWGAGGMIDPHSAEGYLRNEFVRKEVLRVLGKELTQATASFVIAKDVVSGLERGSYTDRHRVLLELPVTEDTDEALHQMKENLEHIVGSYFEGDIRALRIAQAEIEPLKRFVAANLTREELERLREFHDYQESAEKGQSALGRIWQNAQKRALICHSIQSVQAFPAHQAYRAHGRGIHWAVLDSGVDAWHAHFNHDEEHNIAAVWDCTHLGPIRGFRLRDGDPPAKPADMSNADWQELVESVMGDRCGHGTHVAGIIAGQGSFRPADADEELTLCSMAPHARIHSYQVLNDDGVGDDSYIIKALDHIWDLNHRAGKLVIHGLNLSLGGYFDSDSYGCGHSPICRELRRLWQQGVAVVVACGNEGFQYLRTASGDVWPTNLDLSIGDPANLEECIAVGSVNAEFPHTYGISYFSSRGPTADGRVKPDVVAPGERIWSARSRQMPGGGPLDGPGGYYQETGTSMAAPHVSGVIAAYLSVRKEFRGQPDRVKEILMAHCVDLKRDRHFQGAGLVNLIKMLALS